MSEMNTPLDKTLTFFFVPHSFDGSSYYRIFLPGSHFQANTHHRVFIPAPGAGMVNPDIVDEIDVMGFQRPAGREGAYMLEQLVGRTKLVYEVDDDMLNPDPYGLPHLAEDDESAGREAAVFTDSVKRCLRLCDMVTTTNEHLAATLRPYNDNIVILPNHVKAGLLEMQRPQRDRLTIGWAGGTSHQGDIATIVDPLRNVLDGNPDVDMHFIGASFAGQLQRKCRWTKWKADVGDYYKRVDFDIAIAPSEDTVFNRSKTWIRALEMAALGIPIVAQNRLPYSDFVVDGKTGFLVDTAEDWEDRLTALIHDPEMRAELGAAAREQASGWTIEEGWRLWESAYEHAAK